MSNAAGQLAVAWTSFGDALRPVRRVVRTGAEAEAILSFDGACLHLDMPGGGFVVPASGEWPCQVRIPAQWILTLAALPPRCDPIVFRLEGGCLHVESSSVACIVQGPWRAQIQLPVNVSPGMFVALSLRYSPEDIAASGLTEKVAKAVARFEGHVRSAAEPLVPYGVTMDILRGWLENHIRNNAALNRL